MDATADAGGYRPMGPLAERDLHALTSEPQPDYLLQVDDPAAARSAIACADRMVLIDGRRTGWLVLGRLVWAMWFGLLMESALRQAPDDLALLTPQTVAVLLAGLPVLALTTASERMIGVRPLRGSLFADVSAWMVCAAALFSLARANPDAWLGWLVALGVLPYVGAPVWRWWRATRNSGPGGSSWPTGVQAFALLSVLERAESVAPDRLVELAGLPPVNGDRWLARLRDEQAVYGGRRRHWVFGDTPVALTVPGRERLYRMRAELERVAAEAPAG